MSEPTEPTDTVAELQALVAELAARVQTPEEEAAQRHPAGRGEVRLGISAPLPASFGTPPTPEQVRLPPGAPSRPRGPGSKDPAQKPTRSLKGL